MGNDFTKRLDDLNARIDALEVKDDLGLRDEITAAIRAEQRINGGDFTRALETVQRREPERFQRFAEIEYGGRPPGGPRPERTALADEHRRAAVLLDKANAISAATGESLGAVIARLERHDTPREPGGLALGREMPAKPTVMKAGVGYALVFPDGSSLPFYSREMADYSMRALKIAESEGVTFDQALQALRRTNPDDFNAAYRAEQLAENEARKPEQTVRAEANGGIRVTFDRMFRY